MQRFIGMVGMKTLLKCMGMAVLAIAALAAALYAYWPSLVSRLIVPMLADLGMEHVVFDVGRPEQLGMDIALLTFQAVAGNERMTVTIEDARFAYELAGLREGRIDRLDLPRVSVLLTPEPTTSAVVAESSVSASTSLTELLKPIPVLPVREVRVGRLNVRREGGNGRVHEGIVSGSLLVIDGRLRGTLDVQERGGRAYRIDLDAAHVGDVALSLESLVSPPRPILVVRSHIEPKADAMRVAGSLQADLHELAPLLALVIPLEGDFAQVSGKMWLDWSGSASPSIPVERVLLDARTQLNGTLRFDPRLPQWRGLATAIEAKVDGEFRWDGRRLRWTVDREAQVRASVRPSDIRLPEWVFPPSGGDGRSVLTVALSAPAEGTVDTERVPIALTARGSIKAGYGTASDPSQIELSDATISWESAEGLTGEGTLRVRGRVGTAARAMLPAKNGEWKVAADVALDPRQIRLRLHPSSTCTLSDVAMENVKIPKVTLSVRRPVQWTGQIDSNGGAVTGGEFSVVMPYVQVGDQEIQVDTVAVIPRKVERQQEGWVGSGILRVVGVAPIHSVWQVPKTDWSVTLNAAPSKGTVQFEGGTQDRRVVVTGIVAHQPDNGAGEGRVELKPVRFDPAAKKLSDLVVPWTFPFDANRGSVSAVGHVTWGRAEGTGDVMPRLRSGALTVRLDGVAGRIRAYPFGGLSTSATVTLTSPSQWSMPEPADLRIDTVQTGVNVSNVAARIQIGWDDGLVPSRVDLRNVSLHILGGRATSEGLRYELAGETHAFTVRLEQLSMQEILSLEQQKGLEGTGVIDGLLPLTLGKSDVTVTNGVIEARPPGGVIRYRPSSGSAEALTGSSSQMNMVLQPLSNFHYNILKSTAQYGSDGTLKLETRLEGRNPDWQQGRPVHFNLNVEENIPALMRSLEIVQGIEKSIEKQFDHSEGR
ncbi:hypothetical protein YTPLAS18_10560 [Nitrospira sp.]|nr:hypothetical protein YTPLAS18_10560 [Nitrospira sp.]